MTSSTWMTWRKNRTNSLQFPQSAWSRKHTRSCLQYHTPFLSPTVRTNWLSTHRASLLLRLSALLRWRGPPSLATTVTTGLTGVGLGWRECWQIISVSIWSQRVWATQLKGLAHYRPWRKKNDFTVFSEMLQSSTVTECWYSCIWSYYYTVDTGFRDLIVPGVLGWWHRSIFFITFISYVMWIWCCWLTDNGM